MAKYKKFGVMLLREPTEDDFTHYWSKAQSAGIGFKRFESLWFKAYNEYRQRLAEDQFKKNAFKVADVLIQKGSTPDERNVGRTFINKASDYWTKKLGIEMPKLKIEEQSK